MLLLLACQALFWREWPILYGYFFLYSIGYFVN